jgi:hypothetical protein
MGRALTHSLTPIFHSLIFYLFLIPSDGPPYLSQVTEVPVPEALKAEMEARRTELVERLSEVRGHGRVLTPQVLTPHCSSTAEFSLGAQEVSTHTHSHTLCPSLSQPLTRVSLSRAHALSLTHTLSCIHSHAGG